MRLRGRMELGRWSLSGRTQPVSKHWGFDRGTPVDRWYIERWLAGQAKVIRGSVLEVKDAGYTARFGTDVRESQVLDIDPQIARRPWSPILNIRRRSRRARLIASY